MTPSNSFDVNHPLLASVPEQHREAVVKTTFPAMVGQLAKPGADIVKTMTFSKFTALMNICLKVINAGNELDMVKKDVIYNKAVPLPGQHQLPSSAALSGLLDDLTPEKAHLLHMAVGLAGEAAEMLEQVVGHVLGADLDGENVREEAGDSTFYLVGLLNAVQTPLEEAQFANKVKLLGKRYAKGVYSDQQAQERADKPAGE